MSNNHIDNFKQIKHRDILNKESLQLINFITDAVIILKDDHLKFSNMSFQKMFNTKENNITFEKIFKPCQKISGDGS